MQVLQQQYMFNRKCTHYLSTKSLLHCDCQAVALVLLLLLNPTCCLVEEVNFVVQILMQNREAAGTMNKPMFDGTTPLMTAVKLAVEEMVEQLLNFQVEINATDNRGLYRAYCRLQ